MGVPKLPGVPQLPSFSSTAPLAVSLLTADSPVLSLGSEPAQWGIFQGGSPVVLADSVVSFSYKQEWAIADYPVEQGAFETYDKVQIPFDSRFRFTSGGSEANRASLLNSIDTIATDKKTLFDVVTPEKVYPSVTVSHYDLARSATSGVGLISVDVWCFNVIVNGGVNFQSTAAPSGASQQNDGTVQTTSATSQQAAAVGAGIGAN